MAEKKVWLSNLIRIVLTFLVIIAGFFLFMNFAWEQIWVSYLIAIVTFIVCFKLIKGIGESNK